MHKVLEVRELAKYYNNNRAIEGISLAFHEGNAHALIGENGAGKSTLIKCITGLVRPDAGQILCEGEPIIFKNPHQAISKGIVAVHQELSLVDTMTVSQNIWLGHEPKNTCGVVQRAKMEEKSRELIQSLGVKLDVRKISGRLNLADKQIVEILKVFSYDPKIMIFDEATSTLGQEEVERLYQVISILKSKGKSIVFVSHRMNEIFKFCDTCTIFKDGLQVMDANVNELNTGKIIEYMTGYELDDSFPKKLHQMECDKTAHLNRTVMKIRNLSTESGLSDISIDVKSGEILGIGGLQGHGQINLLNALFGLEKLKSGEIELNGEPLHLQNPLQAMKEGIFLVPQDRKTQGLFLELSAAENIIACHTNGISKNGVISRRKETQAVQEIISRLEVKISHATQMVKYLSGGNQQKIALGKWLLKTGKVFLLIEPTRGIDIKTKVEIYELLRKLALNGYAVVMSSNELLELIGLCDRIAVLFEKKMATVLECGEINEQNVLNAAFGKKRGNADE